MRGVVVAWGGGVGAKGGRPLMLITGRLDTSTYPNWLENVTE